MITLALILCPDTNKYNLSIKLKSNLQHTEISLKGQSEPALEGQGQGAPALEAQGQGQLAFEGQGQGQPALEGQRQGQPALEGQGKGEPALEGQGHGQDQPAREGLVRCVISLYFIFQTD